MADTILCLAVAAKIVDYVWTGWDTYQAGRVLADSNASQGEKVVAALNVGMAVFFEVIEPDDLLPVGLPLDDVARRAFMRGAEEALEAGGDAGLRAYVKDQIGDKAADTVLNQMDELIGITPPTSRGGLRSQMGPSPAGMVNAQAHHNLPWKFREWFAQPGRGLDVNDPAFGRWVQGTPPGQHQNWTRAYENAWTAWIEANSNATRQQVLDFLQSLLDSGLYP